MTRVPVHIIVAVVCALHVVQAVCLWTNPATAGVTSIYTVAKFLGPPATAALFVAVAILALSSFFCRRRGCRALLLVPQQCVLFVSGLGAVSFMYLSHFADGVIRSQAFLVADQAPAVLFAIGHAWAIIDILAGER